MPLVDVYNVKNEKVGEIELNDAIFDVAVKKRLIHEVIKWQLAKKRRGTASTKDRSMISGSTRKLYRQKGTGRARAGSIKSPLRVGGGVVFGPKPRDYSYPLPKKIRRQALKCALTATLKEGKLKVLDSIPLEQIKTRVMADYLRNLNLDRALIIIPERDEVVEKSARNIPDVKVLRVAGLNTYDIIKYQNLVLLQSTIPKIEGALLS